MSTPILLVDALVKLLSGNPLQGREPQKNEWVDYYLASDGLTIRGKGVPVPLELLMELEWRDSVKTPDQWVLEAKSLLAMGASSVDAETLKGVMSKVAELEAKVKGLKSEILMAPHTIV